MRKTVLSILLVSFVLETALLNGEPFFSQLALKSVGTLSLSPGGKNTYTGAAGLVLSLSSADFRSFVKIPKSELSELSNAFKCKEFSSIFDSPRHGAGIFLFKKTVPLTIKAGNVSYSKAFSRLKNPVPSLPSSPFTKGFYFSSGISASLPTLASSEERFSLFAEADFSKQKLPFIMQAAYIDDNTALSSIGLKLKFSRYTKLQSYINGGRFFLENKSSYLSKHNCAFDGEWRYALSWENSFTSPFLKLSLSAGLHQSPWNKNSLWINSKLRTGAGPFIVDFGYFAIPSEKDSPVAAPLISANSSVIKTVEQAFINPQLIILTRHGLSLRLGATASETWKITGNTSVASINVAKVSGGILAETKSSSFTAVFAAANILISGTPPSKAYSPDKYYSLSASAAHKTRLMHGSVAMSAKHYPPEHKEDRQKQSLSFDAKAGFGKPMSLILASSFDTTIKGGKKDSSKCGFSATWKIKKKHISSSLKIALTVASKN